MWVIALFVCVIAPIGIGVLLLAVAVGSAVDNAAESYRQKTGKKAPSRQSPQHYMDWPF